VVLSGERPKGPLGPLVVDVTTACCLFFVHKALWKLCILLHTKHNAVVTSTINKQYNIIIVQFVFSMNNKYYVLILYVMFYIVKDICRACLQRARYSCNFVRFLCVQVFVLPNLDEYRNVLEFGLSGP